MKESAAIEERLLQHWRLEQLHRRPRPGADAVDDKTLREMRLVQFEADALLPSSPRPTLLLCAEANSCYESGWLTLDSAAKYENGCD